MVVRLEFIPRWSERDQVHTNAMSEFRSYESKGFLRRRKGLGIVIT